MADWNGCGNDLFMYYDMAPGTSGYYGIYSDDGHAAFKLRDLSVRA